MSDCGLGISVLVWMRALITISSTVWRLYDHARINAVRQRQIDSRCSMKGDMMCFRRQDQKVSDGGIRP